MENAPVQQASVAEQQQANDPDLPAQTGHPIQMKERILFWLALTV